MASGHPSSSKVFEFVEKLEAAVGRCGGNRCDMDKPRIRPKCGTPGCHGGWAAIALDVSFNRDTDFTEGACALSVFLGFAGAASLKDWASRNPDLWGNSCGVFMFCDGVAFGQISDRFPVSIIIDHWRGVGERLSALEAAS